MYKVIRYQIISYDINGIYSLVSEHDTYIGARKAVDDILDKTLGFVHLQIEEVEIKTKVIDDFKYVIKKQKKNKKH